MKAHPAQPQHETREQILEALRLSLSPGAVGARVVALQAAMGHRFNFELLGELVLRATNDELVALHQPRKKKP